MRQHSGKKRLGAVLLSLALCLSLLPTAALAADNVDYIYYEWNETTQILSEPKSGSADSATAVTASNTAWGGDDNQEHWYVVSGTVEISSRVAVTGDVRLILEDNCTLTVNGGINVAEGNSLTIYGQTAGTGTLVAKANTTGCAGIGGGSGGDGGTITIYGGTVSATGSNTGAGIGGGYEGDGSTITIYGGTVSATSSNTGAGIGGGSGGAGSTITIYGGTVSATSRNTGAGIGGGSGGAGGTIAISGGTVTASSSNTGAGIGGGSNGAGGKVTIYGGTVTASSGLNGAGIGNGGGFTGDPGTFSTGENGTVGNAVIFASSKNGSSISDQRGKKAGAA